MSYEYWYSTPTRYLRKMSELYKLLHLIKTFYYKIFKIV